MTPTTTHFGFVHGTGDRAPAWSKPGSPLRLHLASRGWEHIPRQTFSWSGEVGFLLWGFNRHDWDAGADALGWYLDDLQVPLITHSHGAQLVIRYAAKGGKVPVWIDISGPIRREALKYYDAARPNIGRHVFVHDESRWGDWTRIAGQWFDWRLSIPLGHPHAVNVPLKGVGHSGVLNDPTHFHYWDERILPAAIGEEARA